jgi:hypothetical protein
MSAEPMPYVGPPPVVPREPREHRPMHVLHLLMTAFATLVGLVVGLWLPLVFLLIWVIAGMNASGATDQERKRYTAEMETYRQEYDAWQRRYVAVFKMPPPPPAG